MVHRSSWDISCADLSAQRTCVRNWKQRRVGITAEKLKAKSQKLRAAFLIQFPQPFLIHIHCRRSSYSQRAQPGDDMGRVKEMRQRSGDEVAYWRQAKKRGGIDAHHASAHVVFCKVLQQGVNGRNGDDHAI